jgi:cytochrome c oxidase subunit 2
MVVLMYMCKVALAATLLATAGGGTWQAEQPAQPVTQVVVIRAERFSFTPSQIRTTAGTRLEFRLSSDDTIHGFRILDTDVNVEIAKRGKAPVVATFTPSKAGRYTFECSHTCGAGHAFMRGVIVVVE